MNTTPPPAPPQVAAGTPAAPAPVAGLAYHRLSHADPKSRLVLTPAGRSARRRRISWP